LSRKTLKAHQNNMIQPAITAIPFRMIDRSNVKIVTDDSQVEAIHRLRFEILRKPYGLSLENAMFPEDHLASTVHIIAVNSQGLVGCATLLVPETESTIQLRGMAVASNVQGTGVGRLIVLESHVYARQIQKSLWCKARQSAIGFYQRQGWVTTGLPFEIPVFGPHIKMEWHPE